MKRSPLFISILLLLIANSCTNHTIQPNMIQPLSLSLSEAKTREIGGNPEVYNAHQCLKSRSTERCLKNLFKDERKTYLESNESIKLASRGSSVERATITFKGDDLFLLYLDTSNVERPLTTNVPFTQTSRDGDSVLFLFPVKEIGEEIIVRDRNESVVLHYRVIKE